MTNEEFLTALRCCMHTECSKCSLSNGDPMDLECVRELVCTAADLIEKLTERCARYAEEIAVLQEREKWVPVTERLPDQCMDILVSYRDGHILMGTAMCDDWIEEDLEDGKITHWMPLPDVPEVE